MEKLLEMFALALPHGVEATVRSVYWLAIRHLVMGFLIAAVTGVAGLVLMQVIYQWEDLSQIMKRSWWTGAALWFVVMGVTIAMNTQLLLDPWSYIMGKGLGIH